MNALNSRMRGRKACRNAMLWLADYKDPKKAWDECPYGAWLVWLLWSMTTQPFESPYPRVAMCDRTLDHKYVKMAERALRRTQDPGTPADRVRAAVPFTPVLKAYRQLPTTV